jgi:hypothetical protein
MDASKDKKEAPERKESLVVCFHVCHGYLTFLELNSIGQ